MMNRLRKNALISSSTIMKRKSPLVSPQETIISKRSNTNIYDNSFRRYSIAAAASLAAGGCVTGLLLYYKEEHLSSQAPEDIDPDIDKPFLMGLVTNVARSYLLSNTSIALCDFKKEGSKAQSKEGPTGSQQISDDSKSKQPMISLHAVRGPRATMEDRTLNSRDNTFFAIFDGHGGWQVAECAMENLHGLFIEELEKYQGDPEKAFVQSFESLSNKILGIREWDHVGSTAAVVYLQKDHIITANVGDSRAVLCRNTEAIDITNDHKPNSFHEKRRIEKLGGTVSWYGYRGPDRQPVAGMGAYRINGNLAVSRALGDSTERPFVSSEPEILKFERSKDDRFIIVASDGLWDVMSSQEAVDFVQQILDGSYRRSNSNLVHGYTGDRGLLRAVIDQRKSRMAHYLIEESLRKGTTDNVSVLVIWLK